MDSLAVLLCFSFAVGSTGFLFPISVNPENQRFVDSMGREVFFHGTNVVVKQFPWHPNTEGFDAGTFSVEDMKLLKSLGLNMVRLGFMWPGLEPTRGTYNETYLQVMEKIVNASAEYGIYVLLDMHQDVMSRKFCVEGFPNWAANPGNAKNFPEPLHEPYELDPKTGLPSDEDCAKFSWASYYVSEAASVAFQNLYNNTDGLLDSWAAFWAKAAENFKDAPSVLGYELINEPWAGDIYADPLLMVPKIADRMNLSPAYEVVSKAIREKDEKHCIFFEPVTWDDFGVGFDSVPGGDSYRNRSVLSYHYYKLPSLTQALNFRARQRDLERLKCGGMLTEFLTSGEEIEYMRKTMATADEFLMSWIGWDYKPFHPQTRLTKDDNCCYLWNETGLNQIYARNTSRTYPQAVAGHAIKFSFDPSSKEFALVYEVSEDCISNQTVIYLNEDMHYPTGFTVDIAAPPGMAKWSSPEKNQVVVGHSTYTPHGTSIAVSINKKQ